MWDEFVLGGDVQETSKKNVLKAISDQDMIQEVNSFNLYPFLSIAFYIIPFYYTLITTMKLEKYIGFRSNSILF